MSYSVPQSKVLVVNDDASTLLALSSILEESAESLSYEVFLVQSGEEALREVLKHDFAVILLDVSMPGMDGFETADAIHSHPRSASVPIIFITAYFGDELNKLKGYQKGAADYLFAPIIPNIVQAKIGVFVELHQNKLELERKTLLLQDINADLRIKRLQDLEHVNTALNTEIAERRLAEQRATDLATYDVLTGLLSRRVFLERLDQAIIRAARREESLAVMFLDLDKFKHVNDTFGHEVGDELLKHAAEQLQHAVRESDMVARLGGDEFVVLLEGFPDKHDALTVAKKIVTASLEPRAIGSHLIKASTSIGISFYPQDGATAEDLLRHADTAMYHAKQRERGSIQFFHEELNTYQRERNQFEQDVLHALEHNEFELYYQPKVEIATGNVTGVEALLHWHHPRLGLLGPNEFLSKAIESGKAHHLDEWMVFAACAQAKRWRTADKLFELPIAINIDISQLNPELFLMFENALREQDIAPSCIQLEVTESMVVRDYVKVDAIFKKFKEMGITIAIDSFGAGFSSLAVLKTLPISTLKIDPCFMGNADEEECDLTRLDIFPKDTSLVSALLAMAHALGLRVVAEGVATEQQFSALQLLGCDEYQGTFFSEPLQANILIDHLRSRQVA